MKRLILIIAMLLVPLAFCGAATPEPPKPVHHPIVKAAKALIHHHRHKAIERHKRYHQKQSLPVK